MKRTETELGDAALRRDFTFSIEDHLMTHTLRNCTPVLNARRAQLGRVGGRLAVVGGSALMACGDSAGELPLSQAEQPILRGTVDRSHPEVMLLASSAGSLCTGTVIHVAEQTGFLLTAAHCVTEEREGGLLVPLTADQLSVVPGVNFAESTTEFLVDSVSVEPTYDGGFSADVAIVRFSFGDEAAPAVLRPLAPIEDRLAVNDELLLVGYGQTQSDDESTQRRRVTRSIEALDEARVAYSQQDGKGACFGDSGGPGLVEAAGEERVAVVISGLVSDSDEGCAGGFGVAMRVSAYAGFIEGVLAQGSADPEDRAK
jgi:secreted trypsin-like serine protease